MSITPVRANEFVGKSYVVMDALSLKVIDSKNASYQQSVASISKLMTAIVAIENGYLNDLYTVGEEINSALGSMIYVHIGDQITLKDLLYGLMLRSGNDAANVIAKNIGGSIENFVEMMNKKAKEIGMYHTTFKNPSGLDEVDGGNISSSYDMALLMAYCSANPIFNEIVSTKQYQRMDGKGNFKNKNRLLDLYEYCVGGKTGYTKKAKRTLVTKAIKNDRALIIVTINCGNDFEFHQNKYEEVFNQQHKILSKGIYQYNGHSFLIDQDLYDFNNRYQFDEKTMSVITSSTFYPLKSQSFFQMIFSYMGILLGDMIHG